MTYLFIEIIVQEGEFQHNHKILTTTNCKNLEFAVEWYLAHFWGQGRRDFKGNWWWNEMHYGKVYTWEKLSKKDYQFLSKYL